jgi:hypothetical protein
VDFFSVDGRQFYRRGRWVKICGLAAAWYETIENPESLAMSLKKCGQRLDLFTFFQRVPHVEPRYSYFTEPYSVSVIKLTRYEDWYRHLGKNTQRKIKKAKKDGVEVRVVDFDEEFVAGISKIYNETPIRQDRRFPHYNDSLDKVRRENATFLDRSVFLGAYHQNHLIGYAKIIFEEEFADLLQLLSMISHRDKCPTNALLDKAVDVCSARGAGYLAYGDWNATGLGDFKRNNGFTRMDLPRYYVPLNLIGTMALRWGLHRRASERIPAHMVPALKALRRRWLELNIMTRDERLRS